MQSPAGLAVDLLVGLEMTDVTQLLKILLPGLVLLVLVSAVALRLAVKPAVDAILKLREGLRPDQDQMQQRIARLEDEVTRLRAGDLQVPQALDDGSRSKVRRD
jgi:hypothetical protein